MPVPPPSDEARWADAESMLARLTPESAYAQLVRWRRQRFMSRAGLVLDRKRANGQVTSVGPVGIEPTTRGLKVRTRGCRASLSDAVFAGQSRSGCCPLMPDDDRFRAVRDHKSP